RSWWFGTTAACRVGRLQPSTRRAGGQPGSPLTTGTRVGDHRRGAAQAGFRLAGPVTADHAIHPRLLAARAGAALATHADGTSLALGCARILVTRIAALFFDLTLLIVDFHRGGTQLHVIAGLAENVVLVHRLEQRALVTLLAQYPTVVFVRDVVILHVASGAGS